MNDPKAPDDPADPHRPAGPPDDSDAPPPESSKMKAIGHIRAIWFVVIAAIPVVFAANFAAETWRARGPDLGFESFTDTKLPGNIIPTNHTSRFIYGARQTHFWMLDGRREDFRTLAKALGLHRADEVVKVSLHPAIFDGKQAPELLEGYTSRRDDRELLLFVIYPGNQAVFQF